MLSVNTSIPLSVEFDGPEDFFIFLYHIIFATSAVFLAGSVVVGISTTKSLLRQNRFIFMLNTSISDTLTGFSVYYVGLFDVEEGFPSKNGTYYIVPSLLGVNVLTFLFAQIDRYFAISHPFFYCRYVTRPVIISVCVFSWLITYLTNALQNTAPVSKATLIGAIGVMALLVVVVTKILMTIKLYVIARHQLARDPPSAERESKKESLRIVIFVVICFLILWSPSFFNVIMKHLKLQTIRFKNSATNIFAIMARFNALSTPAVYVYGSPALREAVKNSVWGRVCLKRRRRIDCDHVRRIDRRKISRRKMP